MTHGAIYMAGVITWCGPTKTRVVHVGVKMLRRAGVHATPVATRGSGPNPAPASLNSPGSGRCLVLAAGGCRINTSDPRHFSE